MALAVTLVCLFWILIPLLMKGASTLLTVFLVCAYITVVTMVILGGVCRKTVCAALGTVAGTALALLFGLLSQSLLRIDGLRLTDVEPLLQLRQTGTPLGLRGLLVAGVVISALGAVMDVAMSISSALTEVHTVAPDRDGRALFRSGMNIGRDMVGTMTNTLILAFLGSGLSFIIYLYSLGLDPRQLISSPYMATEVISGIARRIKNRRPPADRNRRIRSFPKRFNKGGTTGGWTKRHPMLDKSWTKTGTLQGQKMGQ